MEMEKVSPATKQLPRERPGQLLVKQQYRELPYRPTIDGWTPNRVKCAYDAAQAGNMQELADLWEDMTSDDRIDGVLAQRTHGLLGLPLHFAGGSEQARSDLGLSSDGAPGEWYRAHPEEELVRLLSWGLGLGIGLAQKVPLPRLFGQPQRYRLQTWSPRWLTYDWTGQSGSYWRVTTKQGLQRVVPGGQWVLFTPYGSQKPWTWGKWRSLAFPWLIKHFALEDRANHSEVMGSPTLVGKSPQGGTEPARKRFLTELAALARNGRIVLPAGWDLDMLEAKARTWEIYSESTDWADKALTIILAGQIVTTEGSQGFASGNVQDAIKGDFVRFDAERLSTCLHDQALEPWAFANYGDYSAAPYPVWNTERPVSLSQQSNTYEILGRAIQGLDTALEASDMRVDAQALCEKYDVPLTKGKNEALQKKQAPIPPMPPGTDPGPSMTDPQLP